LPTKNIPLSKRTALSRGTESIRCLIRQIRSICISKIVDARIVRAELERQQRSSWLKHFQDTEEIRD